MKDQVEVIAAAVRSEREACLFYRMVADMVEDPAVKQKLVELADDESSHAQTLDNLHVALTGRAVGEGEAASPEGDADLFEISSRSLEEVLRFAIANETEAHHMYMEQADLSGEPKAAKMFKMLAETEQGHAAYLQLQLERAVPKS